ncbi:helix-turn-helix transcriptional regulator [Streptomyces sp. CA-253872]|uniref:helix-turn-helix transcriptional regulator n=1 Tax=Streptomyces sp. CA-253872 TaxID=3240067 RepID=UPI003D8B809C
MLGRVQNQSLSPVFVGRDAESGVLAAALREVSAPEAHGPRALVLAGEAGVGKTRLVEEFGHGARRAGALVAVGGCVELGGDGLPFAPFAAALRALRTALPEEFARAGAAIGADLARLLPETAAPPTAPSTTPLTAPGHAPASVPVPDTPPAPGSVPVPAPAPGPALRPPAVPHSAEDSARLFGHVTRLLEELSAARPLVLVLEDLHWADASTRHLYAHLLRTLRAGRLLLLATYRSDDLHRRHPLRPLLAELDRLRAVRRIDLARLGHADVRRQLAGILGAEPEATLVDEIYARSDGNAFFVEELAMSLREGHRPGLSENLRELLLVRVEALPSDARRVLRLVAEGGSAVEHPLLAAVSAMPEDALLDALRAATSAHLLSPTPDGDGYRFRHSLVREAVCDDLLPGERSALNRRYAETVESAPHLVRREELDARLAGYWYAAREPAKALPAALRAAANARARHAYAEQLHHLGRALELRDQVPEPEPGTPAPLDLLADAATAGRMSGQAGRAYTHVGHALRLLEHEPAPLRAAWFLTQRSHLATALGRGDGGAELRRAEELVRGLPPSAVHAEVLAHLAGWEMVNEPGPDSLVSAERAVDYARMVGAVDTQLSAHITRGVLRVAAGDIDGGLAELYETKERALALAAPDHIARAASNLPSVLEGIGRSAEAARVAAEGAVICARHGLVGSAAFTWSNAAESLVSLGRHAEAEEALRHAEQPGGGAVVRGFTALTRGGLALRTGDTDAAREVYEALRALAAPDGHAPQRRFPLLALGIGLATEARDVAAGRALLDEALEGGFSPHAHRHVWPLLVAAAGLEATTRGLPAAEAGRDAVLDRISAAARSVPTPVPLWQGYAELLRAELLRARGRATAADWEGPYAAFRGLDRPYETLYSALRLAETLLSAGERERAAHALGPVGETARAFGYAPLAREAAALARRGRLRPVAGASATPAAPPAETLGLTARESEVLRLVASGHSNRRIAEALYISPKTASVHVSRILAKLGVTGRGEAAAVAHRLRLFPEREEV